MPSHSVLGLNCFIHPNGQSLNKNIHFITDYCEFFLVIIVNVSGTLNQEMDKKRTKKNLWWSDRWTKTGNYLGKKTEYHDDFYLLLFLICKYSGIDSF